jgi:hypothetical protein
MTISTTANSVTIGGDGSTTLFNFSFVWFASSAISVIYTDANGVETTLSPTAYTQTLTAAATGSLWGIGGSVLYPLTGSPIASGTTITILRTLLLDQDTSISNQGPFYPQAVEQALDTLCMEIQQIGNAQTYAIRAPIIDATAPNALPPAAQRANGTMTFDSTGQPTVSAATAGATISSPMVPVVTAASLTTALKNLFAGIPTADPHVVGELWSNSGIVTISAG